MSRDTHLCNRCRAIFSQGPDLPSDLGEEQHIVVSGPDGPSGRQWTNQETGKMWTEVCGMFHERGWSDQTVDQEALVQSAHEGCYICTNIWRRYSKFTNKGIRYRPTVEKIEYEVEYISENAFSLSVQVYGAEESSVGRLCGLPSTVFRFCCVLQSSVPDEPVQASVASTTRSQQSMQQARAWIRECEQNHGVCQQARQEFELPKRLIYVREKNGEDVLSASLCNGNTLQAGTPYMTLSHRWGKKGFLILTSKNIEQLEHHIPIQDLYPSFRDALYMTHSIGFNYLWIDSLCIMQDDIQDWERESEAMCQIYKGAVCNIAATAQLTKEGESFLPPQRLVHPIVPPLVHVDWHASPIIPNGGIHGRAFVISEKYLINDLKKDELYSRAWLLQEQLLALRTLHCQGDQIYWECRTSMCNEVWPAGWEKSLSDEYGRTESQIKPFRLTPEDVQSPQDQTPYVIWLEMVSHYSRRSITFSTDRLPALAGIAADTAALLNDTYASGIWKGALHNGLLYQTANCLHSIKEPAVAPPLWDKTPSWSWASLNTPIVFQAMRHPPVSVPLCEITVHPATKAHTSMLEMAGSLMRLDWVKTSPDAVECQAFWVPAWDDPYFHRIAPYNSDARAVWEVHTQEDHWFAQKCYSEFCVHPIPKKKYGEPSEKPYFDALFDNVLFMPVLFQDKQEEYLAVRSFRYFSPYSYVHGLLLWREVGAERGTFRRVGTARLRLRGETRALDVFRGRVGTYQVGIKDEDYCRTDGKGGYTIMVG